MATISYFSFLVLAVRAVSMHLDPSFFKPSKEAVGSDDFKTNQYGDMRQRLENFHDVSYTGVIKVGGQPVKSIIDTGSFELVVFGTNCSLCGSQEHLYDGTKSKNYNSTGFSKTHYYGSGSTSSVQTIDSLRINTLHAPQSFWEVTDADMPILQEDSFAAIFGVGPPTAVAKMAEAEQKQVHEELDSLKKRGTEITKEMLDIVKGYDDAVALSWKNLAVVENLEVQSMSHCLGKEPGSDGYFIWNDTVHKREQEKFAKVLTTGDTYWSANMTSVKLPSTGKSRALKTCKDGCTAIFDTGTSLISAPTAVVAEMIDILSEWAQNGGDCDDLSALPKFEFRINDLFLTLPPEAYIGKVSNMQEPGSMLTQSLLNMKNSSQDVGNDADTTKSQCSLLMMPMDDDLATGPAWILGMPFFREYYTSFIFKKGKDKGHNQPYALAFSKPNKFCYPGWAPGNQNTRLSEDSAPAGRALSIDARSIHAPKRGNHMKPPAQHLLREVALRKLGI